MSTIVGADAHIGPPSDIPLVGADAHIGPPSDIPLVGADAHIGPPSSTPPVGADAHIGPPSDIPLVGADAHIGPPSSTPPVGADAHIGPHPKLTPIGMVVEKYLRNIPGVGCYVIMPNHIHMLLHISAEDPIEGPIWSGAPTRANIPQLMRSFKTLVSKELGYGIWQRSYYDHIIRNEADYYTHVQYITENPAKWYYDDYYTP